MSLDSFTFKKITDKLPEIIEEFIDAKIAAKNSEHIEDVIRVDEARERLKSILETIANRL